MPQGGLDVGEELQSAVLRELTEETGIQAEQVDYVGQHPRWLAYELPPDARRGKVGRGQVQKWFLFRIVNPLLEVDLTAAEHAEFDAYEWVALDQLARDTWHVRQHIYAELARHFERQLQPG